jgi:superfamily I DNA and/or RNA helicase/very-short-patch-repair endonuclease
MIQEIPNLLQTLKPCWMMSPLSVSQLVEANKKTNQANQVKFDLVIFDEASQIRTEDAICAIYRADQLILAGDSNQLPPTNFFNYISDDDDYENNNFESVLDECSVFLKSHTLNWHYRSRHEDLIKFSNANIYDGQLITFPSAIARSKDYGVDFEFIPEGNYERGSRFNRKEAQRVAEAILEHYSSNPTKSLGVIAFSEAQQFAIERELAKILRSSADQNHEFLDEEKSDSLFIKNLENVQGDERDYIFFSIGYAYDKKGTLSHNFGPLNREGGHRRLNVAVTRARNKLKVFSSIHSSDIDLNRTNAQGAILLKKYLAFAESSSGTSLDADELDKVDNNLPENIVQKALVEESIAKALESRGYQVQKFLGSSDYRIDLAVRNPKNPDEFILAIETDGEMYRSAKTTRDRERLRREVLESLGWKVHRIWARDWIRNYQEELEKVIKLIN